MLNEISIISDIRQFNSPFASRRKHRSRCLECRCCWSADAGQARVNVVRVEESGDQFLYIDNDNQSSIFNFI